MDNTMRMNGSSAITITNETNALTMEKEDMLKVIGTFVADNRNDAGVVALVTTIKQLKNVGEDKHAYK